MSCNLKIVDGKEMGFTDAGTPSMLFRDAVNKLGEEQGKEIFLVSLSDNFKDTIPPVEKYDSKKVASKYSTLINKIKKEQPEDYWSVDIPSMEDIQSAAEDGRIADVQGGMGIVTEDGNMVGLFKYDNSKTGTAAAVQAARVQMGGIKLDNFDGYLTKTYKRNGFRVVSRVSFNEEYAPEGWVKEKHGTPDVVFMIYDPNNKLDIEERRIEDYDEAKAYRDTYVDEAKIGHPAYSVNPSNSSNYANLTEDGKGNFVFFHRGAKGYETIKKSSSSASRATSAGESAALSKVGGLAMFYTKQKDTESQVSYQQTYAIKVPMEKVYDFNTDPLNLIEEAKELHSREYPNAAFDVNSQIAYITKIAGQKGYDMVVSDWNGRTRAQTTKELTPSDIEEREGNTIVKAFKKEYISNTDKGYISSIPKMKDEVLEEVYKSIHNERNSQNKYDSLYHLASSPSRPSQEDITTMIMNSDISEELKSKYQATLNMPVQVRESFRIEEPTLEQVIKFVVTENEVKEALKAEQIQDYKNSLIGTKGFTFDNLQKAFYDKDGIFFISPSKLVSSGLYSEYEAENLQKDFELQQVVKESIEALKNTDALIELNQEDFEQVEKEDTFNSFGKLNNLNPYIVQKEIQEALAGITREEFDEAIGELPFPNFQKSMESEEAREALFKRMQEYKKAEVMLEDAGEIKPSLNSNTEILLAQAAQDLEGTKVLKDISYILDRKLSTLRATPAETLTLIKSIEKNLIKQGYDAKGLASKKVDERMLEYFIALEELAEIPTRTSLGNYAAAHDKYFGSDLSPKKGFIKSKQDDRNFVKLDTKLSQEDVYQQQGLIKQSEGTYIKVNKKTSEELYPILFTYSEKFPNTVKTEEQLRKYVQSQVRNEDVSDAETAEVINLFKVYYNIPLQEGVKREDASDFNQKQAQFTGNQEYLLGEFISDFYIESLQAREKEDKAYKNFYKNFEITENGLELVNNDPITIETVKRYATEDLKNYSLLSKSMPSLISQEVEFVDSRNSRRNTAGNYPSTVPNFEGNISILNNQQIIAKNTNSEFIKLKGEVYENLKTIGNLSLFKKLDTSESKFLNFAVEKPTGEALLEDYLHLENKPELFIKNKNYLSKEEKEGLSEDEFGCL